MSRIRIFASALGPALNRQTGSKASSDDHASEGSFAGRVLAATKQPFWGLTLATDETSSARLWLRDRRDIDFVLDVMKLKGEGVSIAAKLAKLGSRGPQPTDSVQSLTGQKCVYIYSPKKSGEVTSQAISGDHID